MSSHLLLIVYMNLNFQDEVTVARFEKKTLSASADDFINLCLSVK